MSLTETLLIEIGTEELPPQGLATLSQHFAQYLSNAFDNLGIPYQHIDHFSTPRRIAVRFHEIPNAQPNRTMQKRGPTLKSAFDSEGRPTAAAQGFAKSCGINVSQLFPLETPEGSWLCHQYEEKGENLNTLLGPLIEKALNELPASKRMRWGTEKVAFLRPIHWITALHGATPLPVKVFHFTATHFTFGHPVYHTAPIPLFHANDYLTVLLKANVMVNSRERQETIRQQIEALAKAHQATAIIDENLLEQVNGLVEWPMALMAHFDETFLKIPAEALISSMQNHQKCFPLQDQEGKLLPLFILISNITPPSPQLIIQGNERVMQARLADAKFFFEKDRKVPLAERLDGLKNMIFQKKLGTLYDKSQRIAKLAGQIAEEIQAPVRPTERAAKLAKADLLTAMVFEFPELQGIMGSYYAKADGESDTVATAIYESYLPRFAKDSLPETLPGISVALADRLDTLIGIFGIRQLPTGDKDPFALRRQAVGIIRLLIEKALALDLAKLCQAARQGYGNFIEEDVVPQVLQFCFDRLRAWYEEQGIRPQVLEAVLATHPTQPYDCSRRLLAVAHFQSLPQAQQLSSANKRVRNLLQKADVTFHLRHLPSIEQNLLKEPAEQMLFQEIEKQKMAVMPLLQTGQYQEALIALANLQAPVDAFFETVLVMSDEEKVKQNRLALLCHLHALFMQIADISKLSL